MSGKRRANGSGTIRQRADGRWEGRVRFQGKSHSVYGKTQTEVKKKMKALNEKIMRDNFLYVGQITVGDLLSRYVYEVKVNELKPKSLDALEFTAKQLVEPHLGKIKVGDLTTIDGQRMVNALRQENYAYSSINKAYGLVNAAFKYGMMITPPVVTRNPCVGVKLPKTIEIPMSEITIFSEDEVKLICDAALERDGKGQLIYKYGNGVVILFFTGLRYSELAGLEWKNVDFAHRKIYVRGNVVSAKDRAGDGKTKTIIQKSSKTQNSDRVVPICDTVYEALLQLKELSDGDFVLTTQNGTPVDYWNFSRMFHKIQDKVGIPRRGLHACRHTFASMLFKRGIDAKVVAEILGHADVSITYNTYIHLIQEQKDFAITYCPR